MGVAAGVLLCHDRNVEFLILPGVEDSGGVLPIVDEGGVGGAEEKSSAGEDSKGFGDGGLKVDELRRGGNELG